MPVGPGTRPAMPGQGEAGPCPEGAEEPQVMVEQVWEQLDLSPVGCGLRGPAGPEFEPL